jgi:DNA-directed RNA polymerase subunit K/omega
MADRDDVVAEDTLLERAQQMYRQLALLQRVFQSRAGADTNGADDKERDRAVVEAILEIVEGLIENASQLRDVPFPVSQWRAGDGSDDPRWRALTDDERGQLRRLLAGYEGLIEWGTRFTDWATRLEPLRLREGGPDNAPELTDAAEYLAAERSRLARMRQELSFLEDSAEVTPRPRPRPVRPGGRASG